MTKSAGNCGFWSHVPKKSLMENFIFCAVKYGLRSLVATGTAQTIGSKILNKQKRLILIHVFQSWKFCVIRLLMQKIFLELKNATKKLVNVKKI